MRILVIEDHALVREGMLLALKALDEGADSKPAEILGVADAEQADELLARDDDFDLILIDLMLPGTSGSAFAGVVRKLYPHIPVVVVSAVDDADTVMKLMRSGAAGFVSKASPTHVLLEALREVLAGEIWIPPEYREISDKRRRRSKTVGERYGLTIGQARVLDLLAEGKTNREIGEMLKVTEGTVKIHVSAILRALGVSNRSQALLIAQGKRA